MKYLFLFSAFLLTVISCKKEPIGYGSTCEGALITQLEMVPYEGERLGCKFFLMKYVNGEDEKFAIGNNCIDMIFILLDCNGQPAFESDSEMTQFMKDASYLGIIAYSPE